MAKFIDPKGRGTVESPPNRFERLSVEEDDGAWEEIAATDPDFEKRRPLTETFRDDSQSIITKNALVTRDLDLLSELSHFDASAVMFSITSLDSKLAGLLEPGASRPQARLDAVGAVSEAGIPVGISLAPMIPGLNEHEIPALLEAAADHGAEFASYTILRLPYGVKDIFADWLERRFPGRKETIPGRIRDLRGGALNKSEFGSRMTGDGPQAEQIRTLFRVLAVRVGLNKKRRQLSTASFRKRLPGQMELF